MVSVGGTVSRWGVVALGVVMWACGGSSREVEGDGGSGGAAGSAGVSGAEAGASGSGGAAGSAGTAGAAGTSGSSGSAGSAGDLGDGLPVGRVRLVSASDRRTVTEPAAPGPLVLDSYYGIERQEPELRGEAGVRTPHSAAVQLDGGAGAFGAAGAAGTGNASERCWTLESGQWSLGPCDAAAEVHVEELPAADSARRPRRFRLRTASGCLVADSGQSTVQEGDCSESGSEWYLEELPPPMPVQRVLRPLLIIKQHTALTQVGLPAIDFTMPQSNIEAVTQSFQTRVKERLAALTGGAIDWQGEVAVSTRPLQSVSQGCGHYMPVPEDMADDVAEFFEPGVHDGVLVYWSSSDASLWIDGGWGCSGANTSLGVVGWGSINYFPDDAAWLSGQPEPMEVWIHEWLHQPEQLYGGLGVEQPEGGLHGAAVNLYERWDTTRYGYAHWYRDYLLGKLITADGRYVGLGEAAWSHGMMHEQ